MTDRIRVVHPEGGPLMTKQSMAAETDVNQIMARWIAHGQVPRSGAGVPKYGDFSSGMDFQSALNAVREAEEEFSRLPAHIRRHCQNDPGEFLSMVYDPERRGELEKLGLLELQAPEAAPPPVVEPVEPA